MSEGKASLGSVEDEVVEVGCTRRSDYLYCEYVFGAIEEKQKLMMLVTLFKSEMLFLFSFF